MKQTHLAETSIRLTLFLNVRVTRVYIILAYGSDFYQRYSQALVGDREDHAVGRFPLLLHLSVELLIHGFTSVCWSGLWFGCGFERGERDETQ